MDTFNIFQCDDCGCRTFARDSGPIICMWCENVRLRAELAARDATIAKVQVAFEYYAMRGSEEDFNAVVSALTSAPKVLAVEEGWVFDWEGEVGMEDPWSAVDNSLGVYQYEEDIDWKAKPVHVIVIEWQKGVSDEP